MNKTKFYTDKKNMILLATLCCALWGSAYPAIKIGYELFNIAPSDIPSKLIFAGYRFALAGIILLIIQGLSKKHIFALNKKDFMQITWLGIIQTAVQYTFFYVGMAYASGVSGSIVNGTGTFFSILLAHFIYKNDRLNSNKVLGCVIGFMGVVIVNLNGGSLLESSFTFKGEGFVMIAAFILSATGIYSKKITQNKDATLVTAYQLFIGGAVLTIVGFSFGGTLVGFNINSVLLLIYMALLSSVAFALWAELLKYNKVGTIAMFNFSIPVFGTLLSGIFLGENIFNIKILVALVLVCTGIFLVYRVKDEEREEVGITHKI